MADDETDPSEGELLDRASCSGLRKEMLHCIVDSDCMRKHGLGFKQCLSKDAPGVDENCRKVQYLFFECKRSMLDMRQRFRAKKGY